VTIQSVSQAKLSHAVKHESVGGTGTFSTMTTPPPLQPIDENWTTGLAVVAHPDDLEYGAAAAIARWTSQGKKISYCLATSGEAGIDGMSPEEAGPLRENEQREAAAIVGVDSVEFLGFQDGVLEYGLPLRRAIARAIRRAKPEIVITGNYRETFGPGLLNQADHVAAGRAVIDAIRDAGNRWVFRELLEQEGLETWSPRWLLVGAHPEPTHGVDVSGEPLERGIASLEAHKEYLAGIPGHPPVRVMISAITRMQGRTMGTANAVLFRAYDFQAPPVRLIEAMQEG